MHIPLATAGEWLGSAGDVTNVGVVLDDSAAVAGVVARLERALDEPIARGDAHVMSWREANPALGAAVAIDDFGNYLTQGFIFTIIAFGIVNTVLMSVLHRRREFGVLRALGLTPGQTGTIVLIEGLTLTAASGLIGVAIGLAVTWYISGNGLDFSALMDEMTFSAWSSSRSPSRCCAPRASCRCCCSFCSSARRRRSIRRCGRRGSTWPRR